MEFDVVCECDEHDEAVCINDPTCRPSYCKVSHRLRGIVGTCQVIPIDSTKNVTSHEVK